MRTPDNTFVNNFNALQKLDCVKKLGGNSDDDLISEDEVNAALNDVTVDPNLRAFAQQLKVNFGKADQWGADNAGGKAGDHLININEAFNVNA